MKILLAVDGSACSDEAVIEVSRLPWPAGSEVKVLNVMEAPHVAGAEPWALPQSYFEVLENDSRRKAQAIVDDAVSKLEQREGHSLEVTSEVVQGSPKKAILEIAEGLGADLIVMGSRGLGAFKRFLLGSVSSSVALHAGCSVEIVRRHETCPAGTQG